MVLQQHHSYSYSNATASKQACNAVEVVDLCNFRCACDPLACIHRCEVRVFVDVLVCPASCFDSSDNQGKPAEHVLRAVHQLAVVADGGAETSCGACAGNTQNAAPW